MLNRNVTHSGVFLLGIFFACHAAAVSELRTVEKVDLNRYIGVWYEIAKLPNSFQKKCMKNVSAKYTVLGPDEIQVVNRCQKENAEYTEAEGKAKRASGDTTGAKLKVRFAPAFLSFLPFVWGDYWIIELAPDYSYAVVGEPSRTYFWILSRSKTLSEEKITGILERASKAGFDVSKVVRTKQDL